MAADSTATRTRGVMRSPKKAAPINTVKIGMVKPRMSERGMPSASKALVTRLTVACESTAQCDTSKARALGKPEAARIVAQRCMEIAR